MSDPPNQIDAPPETVYRVWTERTGEWFAPRPYTMPVVNIDFRPGGGDIIEMQAPDGIPCECVILEVIPNRRIVMTDVFKAGWIPNDAFMVSIFTFEPEGSGTRYTARPRAALERRGAQAARRDGLPRRLGHLRRRLAELTEEEANAYP